MAQSQMALFPEPWPVVVLSGSCGGMMHHHYARLFPERPEVAAFCEQVFEFTEFLARVCRVRWQHAVGRRASSCTPPARPGARCGGAPRPAACWGSSRVTLNEQAYESECCGFGGTFSVRHPTSARPWSKTRPATCWRPVPIPW